MTYISFFQRYWRILSFTLLLTFFSSFGQTFLLSLYLPFFIDEFGLSEGRLGTMYAVATLLSGLCLPYFGRRLDTIPLKTYTAGVVGGLAFFSFLAAVSNHAAMLFIAFLGLRLCGQGLCGHTAMTTAARYFNSLRGKAVSIASLGFPIGEALFPVSVTLMIAAVGWRYSWVVSAGAIAFILFPLSLLLLSASEKKEGLLLPKTQFPGKESAEQRKSQAARIVFKDPRFYGLLAASLPLPFFITGLIFYQLSIGAEKGWGAEIFAAGFVGFAIARALFALLTGPLIDRFRAVRLLPLPLLPLGLGLIVLLLFDAPWVVFLYLSLLGLSFGIGGSVMSAVWAEVYGVENLGAIRSIVTTIAIFSTALAPFLFGLLLDWGVGVQGLLLGSLVTVFVSLLLALFTRAAIRL